MQDTPSELIDRLLKLLDTPDAEVPAELLEALHRQCPTLTVGDALALRRNGATLDETTRRALMSRVALHASDPAAFNALARPRSELSVQEPFYPSEAPETPATEDAITTFLETYGHGASPQEDALLERLIFNPTPDYASVLEKQYGSPGTHGEETDQQLSAIDSFIAAHTPPVPAPVAKEETPEPARTLPTAEKRRPAQVDSEAPLTSSLAKLFIRRGHYQRAFDILSRQNLPESEKSAYFADQMRFLRRLMALQEANKIKEISQQP